MLPTLNPIYFKFNLCSPPPMYFTSDSICFHKHTFQLENFISYTWKREGHGIWNSKWQNLYNIRGRAMCTVHYTQCIVYIMRGRWILLSVALGGIIIIWDEFDSCRFCKGKIDQLWVSCAVGGTSQSDEEVLNLRSTCHTALDACERDSSCRWTSLLI